MSPLSDETMLAQAKAGFAKGFREQTGRLPSDRLIEERARKIVEEFRPPVFMQAVREEAAGYAMARRHKLSLEIDIAKNKRDLNLNARELQTLREIKTLVTSKPIMSKPNGSVFHKLTEALEAKDLIYILPEKYPDIRRNLNPGGTTDLAVMVVEHDWAGAFTKADFEDGEWRAPYEDICFEFIIGGKRICALLFDDGDYRGLVIFAQTSVGWASLVSLEFSNGKWSVEGKRAQGFDALEFTTFITDQIRAICISLDADVVETEVVRAPHKLNRARAERGKLPLYDYHVLSLARRSRVKALPPEPGHELGHKKRLHWRRGHWRHFESSKTWIKWMLVGNPDLGFVDKHYRL